jgi:hypothetical protein
MYIYVYIYIYMYIYIYIYTYICIVQNLLPYIKLLTSRECAYIYQYYIIRASFR